MTLTIHPSGLPDGAIGYPYDAAMAGTGGIEPYDFSLSRGTLPPGITLTEAVLTGTATTPGTFSFTIQMVDASSSITSRSYSVNILPMVPAIIVEDGSIVDGANSYLALTDLYTNQASLGIGGLELTALNNLSPTSQANLLVWGTAYLDRRFRFYGQALDQTQSLQWPRTRNYDDRGFTIDPGTIPPQLLKGLAFLTTAAAANPKITTVENTAIPLREQQWSMDGVSMTYATPPKDSSSTISEADVVPLFEQSLPDLEVLLRSIGELKDLAWVTTDRQSVVNR